MGFEILTTTDTTEVIGRVDGATVVLPCEAAGPVSIRYNQDNRRLGNLYNMDVLPAVPLAAMRVE